MLATVFTLHHSSAQIAGASTGPGPATVPVPTPCQVVDIGPNYRVWQWQTFELLGNGQTMAHVHSYTELASGLNYLDASGQYVPAQEQIEAFAGGAIARQGQYQVIFANNLNSAGSIDLQTADGKRLQSSILGLAYYDTATGQSVLIAQLQDSTGDLIAANQVLYPNAFSGVKADVRYTYKQGSFEQDVILREQPPTPESLGLNSQSTEIEVMTEFIDPPPETITASAVQPDGETDQDISWGAARIGHGLAFDLGEPQNPAGQVSVIRQYVTTQGRKLLLEKVPLPAIQAALQELPLQSSLQKRSPMLFAKQPILPARPLIQAVAKPMKLALAAPAGRGFVLDYVVLNGSPNNFTFQAGTTYCVSNAVYLNGLTTIGSNAVIKFARASLGLDVYGAISCNASADHPAMLTAVDDNSVGDPISGSTGSPSGVYSTTYLVNYGYPVDLEHLRVSYAMTGIELYTGSGNLLRDCQFYANGCDLYLLQNASIENCLFQNTRVINLSGSSVTSLNLVNCTVHDTPKLLSTFTSVGVTNSLLIGVTNFGANFTSVKNATNLNDAGIFETSGSDAGYLAGGSPYRNVGTTNIAPVLWSQLQTLTTYTPQDGSMPDTGLPDLGYHYPLSHVSLGTDFWLAFCGLYDNLTNKLSLYISSPVGATGTVTTPGLMANGPILVVTNCGDTTVNGTYMLTNLTAQEQADLLTNGFLNIGINYVHGTHWVVSGGPDYWVMLAYDSGTHLCTSLYDIGQANLNGNWGYDGDPGWPYPTAVCAQVPLVNQTFTVAAGAVTNISIPLAVMPNDGNDYDTVETNGIHVAASQPISVYAFDYDPTASAAYTGYPTTLLGTNYCVMARDGGGVGNSELAIVATANNTTVTITPSPTADLEGSVWTAPFTLQAGETYQVQGGDDVTGTLVASDKPVGVFAGSNLAYVQNGAGNPLVQEQLPVEEWGTQALGLSFDGRMGDTYRVLTANSNTVTISGAVVDPGTLATNYQVVVTNLAAGQFYETILAGPVEFQASQPIQVAHFANGSLFDNATNAEGDKLWGDPCEILLPPTGHYLMANTVATGPGLDSSFNPPAGFDENYLNIIVVQSAITNTFVDTMTVAATNFVAIGNSGYYGARIPVAAGSHTVTSSQPVSVEVYGFGYFDAYGYFGGVVK